MDTLELELKMMNRIKQLLGDMILKQRQMDKMYMNTTARRPRGRPKLVQRTPEEDREA